ncbi:MAG TPA: aspartyl protease family protein [Lacunisphaera sp.]|jgi:hypothetical protein
MKYLSGLFFCLAFLAVASSAGAEVPIEKVFVTGPRSVSLPFEVSSQGQLFTTIRVSGRALKMLIDTGGANTSLDRDVAINLGIKPEGGIRAIAVGGAVVDDIAAHADIAMAEFLVHQSPIRLLDLSGTKKALKEAGFESFDGIIGIDLLLFLRARIDLGHRMLQLYRP